MTDIRPLLLSSFDSGGGAARAALRLHQAFLREGIPSSMAVELGSTDSDRVIGPKGSLRRGIARARPVLDRSPLLFYPRNRSPIFSPAWLPGGGAKALADVDHNVLNMHWINAGFLSIEAVGAATRPLVWTLHDMWPMTGGCHHSDECRGFKDACGSCPQLGSQRELDLSRLIYRRKERSWDADQMTVVAPAKWLAELAGESSLFRNSRIEVIPNPIDSDRYKPVAKSLAREVLGLPSSPTLVGFGAADPGNPRKGGDLLREALRRGRFSKGVEVVIFGAGRGLDEEWSVPVHRLGRLYDDVAMSLVYSAVDMVVQPSMAEVQSLVVAEAMACGTPSVAFGTSGMEDLITSGVDGLLATPFDLQAFADGIEQLSVDADLRKRLGDSARHRIVSEFSARNVVARYRTLFMDLLDAPSHRVTS